MGKIYLIGSLRNPVVRSLATKLRQEGHEVFDDWHAAGEDADEHWMKYEKERGRTFFEAIEGHAARHTFYYDKEHLDSADLGILVAPAGKSAHLELGYLIGKGTPGIIYMPEEPERWDVMVLFADEIITTESKLLEVVSDIVEYSA